MVPTIMNMWISPKISPVYPQKVEVLAKVSQKIAPLPVVPEKKVVKKTSPKTAIRRTITKFYSGWCTSYVAQKRKITWSGNAGRWYANAKSQGYKVGSTPKAAAIFVEPKIGSRNCKGCGHVSFVEKVEKGRFLVSEMNYVAFGVVSRRWITVSSGQHFIY